MECLKIVVETDFACVCYIIRSGSFRSKSGSLTFVTVAEHWNLLNVLQLKILCPMEELNDFRRNYECSFYNTLANGEKSSNLKKKTLMNFRFST